MAGTRTPAQGILAFPGRVALSLLALLALTGAPSAVLGQTAIGNAPIARANLTGSLGGARPAAINSGDTVYLNQTVRTDGQGLAKLVFLDNTNLSVGPSSNLVLDRFVYSGGTQSISLNLARGAFRFATGDAEKRAYQIRTPVATIGVRGTVLDILSENGRTVVKLVEGQATVCMRSNPNRCVSLTNPGDTVVITNTSIALQSTNWDFGQVCRRGVTGLCDRVDFASLSPRQAALFEDALCGR